MIRRLFLGFMGVVCAIATPVQAEGPSCERPCVEIKDHAEAKQRSNRPAPVTIVETPEQKERAEQSERASAEHEAADLEAQRSAADGAQRAAAAAERQEIPTMVLATIGTIVAAIALAFSIRTANRNDRTTRLLEGALVDLATIRVDQVVVDGRVVAYRAVGITRNTGRTRAKRFRSVMNFTAPTERLPDDFDYADQIDVPPPTSLGPNMQSTVPVIISLRAMEEIQAERRFGYIYGWADYVDIFGEPHRTEWCAEVEVIGNPRQLLGEREGLPLNFPFHGKYNGTDEECLYRPGETPPVRAPEPAAEPPPIEQSQ